MAEIKDYKVRSGAVKQARTDLLEQVGCFIPEGRLQGNQLDRISKLLDRYVRLRDKEIMESGEATLRELIGRYPKEFAESIMKDTIKEWRKNEANNKTTGLTSSINKSSD